jgi:chemotaxis protein MotB
MLHQPETGGGVPEWIITYGDVMSLLLTFFIMLAAMSQIKKEDHKYQAVVESLRQQFGYDEGLKEIPGEYRARNSAWQFLTNLGRAKRKDLATGGNDVTAATGDNFKVEAVRPGQSTVVGAAIFFDEDSAELPETGQQVLASLVPAIVGKPQKIEIRGHASRKPVKNGTAVRDHWDLAYQRCHNIMQYLMQQGIEPNRFRLSSAGASEPVNNSLVPALRQQNARVEVILWDEQVDDYATDNTGNPLEEGGE